MGAKPRKPKICLQLVWQRDANAFDHVKIFVLATFGLGHIMMRTRTRTRTRTAGKHWRQWLPDGATAADGVRSFTTYVREVYCICCGG